MDIAVEYQITADDLAEVANWHLKVGPRRHWAWRVAPMVGAVIISSGLCVLLMSGLDGSDAAGGLGRVVLLGLPLGGFGVLMILLLFRRTLRRAFFGRRLAQSPNLQQPQQARFTESGVELNSTAAESRCAWHYFIHFAETPNLLLYYSTPRLAHLIPKRAFGSLADMHEVLAVSRARVGNRPIGFPVQPPV